MMTGLIQDQNLEKQIEKQIGCMSGFLHIFDRQQLLAGKRIYSTKRLPPSTGETASPESVKSVKSVQSPARREIEKRKAAEAVVVVPESPERFKQSPKTNSNHYEPATPPKSPLPLPMFDLKEGSIKSSWKFCKEMPRLSLDSRATVDSKGSLCPRENGGNAIDDKQRRSPSVIARLMGLDQLPSTDPSSSPESVKKPELRRSASESRVHRELFHSRFIDCNNFQTNHANQTNTQSPDVNLASNICVRENMSNSRNQKSESPKISQWRSPQQRRSFFDSADIFPEPKQTTTPMYAISEKSLKLRGLDEQSNDLETLKHILEALQLKGLLHSKRPVNRDSHRNFVHDPSFSPDDSHVVLMKPWRNSPASVRRVRNYSGGANRYSGESLPSISPRKERGVLDRSGRSPVRGGNPSALSNSRNSSNTIVKRKPLSIDTQRSFHESSESRRSSPINSPKLTPKRSGSDYQSLTNRSPRTRKTPGAVYSKEKIARNFVIEDETSSFSESTGSSTSQSDPERSKMEEYREGKSLLERCDKLLHSIAEMSMSESQPSCASVLPSPVSVLDSAFDKDESSSPSPVMKRSIDFKDLNVDLEDDIWSSIISPATSTKEEEFISDDSDFSYISEILRASKYLPDESSVFFYLEKQQNLNGNDTSKAAKLRRELIFDVVAEIIDRSRQLPPWSAGSESGDSVKQICSEFQKIRERDANSTDNLLDPICGVLKRDLAGNNGWGDFQMETSEAVLYIERLIFKDLVSETIRDLADYAAKSTFFAPRRKLVF